MKVHIGTAFFGNERAQVEVNGLRLCVESKLSLLRDGLCNLQGNDMAVPLVQFLNDTPSPLDESLLFCHHWTLVELAARYWRWCNEDREEAEGSPPSCTVQPLLKASAAKAAWQEHMRWIDQQGQHAPPPPLTLQPRRWYAMLLIDPGGAQNASPIWVYDVRPLKTRKKLMELHFWHANYPEGVQEKTYRLRVLRHESGFLLAEKTGEDPKRLVLLSEVTSEWLRPLFLDTPEGDLQAWLDRRLGHR